MSKKRKVITVLIVLILVIIIQELTDDRMRLWTNEGNITSLNYEEVINKLKKKLDTEDLNNVFILGTVSSQNNDYNDGRGFNIQIIEDDLVGLSSNIAVETNQGVYDVYAILKSKKRLVVDLIEKNIKIDNVGVTLSDVFDTLENTVWTNELEKLTEAHQYQLCIKPNYLHVNQIDNLLTNGTYIISEYNKDYKDERFFEIEVEYYNEEGYGKNINLDLILKVKSKD